MEDTSARRRRKVVSTTPNACSECRIKRTKCDGKFPCTRCASREGLVCVYEPHLKLTKEAMQAEIGRLREEWQTINAVLKLLQNHEQPGIILEQLRSNQPLESIIASGQGETAPESFSRFQAPLPASASDFNVRSADSRSSSTALSGSVAVSNSSRPQSTIGNPNHSLRNVEGSQAAPSGSARLLLENEGSLMEHEPQRVRNFPPAKWTAITTNDALVDHLLALYFCWEYPTFASLSKEHFISDFNSGDSRFCSSLLVNAVLALGAKSSDLPEARKHPTDPLSAGDHFFEEAKRLLGGEEVPSLTTIQALGLMSLRQASCGKDASSFHYARQSLRMALDIDLQRRQQTSMARSPVALSRAEREVRTATFWGCFNLEQAWSLCIGRPSQVTPGDIEIEKPKEIEEIEHEDWTPYTDVGLISQDYHQPNNIRSVYRCFSELSEIINLGMGQLYSQAQEFDSHRLLSAYHKLLEWYDALPDQLRLGLNFTPTVLFTHMYYHFAILLLFRPFHDLSLSGSATSPRNVCKEAAQNLFTLIKSYKDLYTLRRVPSFVPYMILTANLASLVDLTQSDKEAVSDTATLDYSALSYLEEMCPSHHFAERALDIMDYFARRWGVKTQEDSVVRVLRSRLQGAEGIRHKAREYESTDTFFLPASESSIEPKAGSLQLKNFSISGPILSLFPQQGRQFSPKFDRSHPGNANREVGTER